MPLVESIADAFTAAFSMVTKSLPSEEERLMRFKLKYPKRYMRVKLQILKSSYRYLRHHRNVGIEEYVNFIGGEISESDRKNLIEILKKQTNTQ